MERYLAIFLGVLMLGSLGAFLLYVPILPLAVVVTLLLSLILMFILGVQARQTEDQDFADEECWAASGGTLELVKSGGLDSARIRKLCSPPECQEEDRCLLE